MRDATVIADPCSTCNEDEKYHKWAVGEDVHWDVREFILCTKVWRIEALLVDLFALCFMM